MTHKTTVFERKLKKRSAPRRSWYWINHSLFIDNKMGKISLIYYDYRWWQSEKLGCKSYTEVEKNLADWLERLTANANGVTLLFVNPNNEGRQMKQCWIEYFKKSKTKSLSFIGRTTIPYMIWGKLANIYLLWGNPPSENDFAPDLF